MAKKIRNLSLDLGATVAYRRLTLSIVPFRFARPSFRYSKTIGECSYHLMFGPFHLWTMKAGYLIDFSFTAEFSGGFHDKRPDLGVNPFSKWFGRAPADQR